MCVNIVNTVSIDFIVGQLVRPINDDVIGQNVNV